MERSDPSQPALSPSPRRAAPSKRKAGRPLGSVTFNEQRVQSLALKGVSDNDIAKTQNVNQASISRYLQRVLPDRGDLEAFKSHRADVLASLHQKALSVKQRILASFDEDTVIAALTPNERVNLLHGANSSGGTDYDKERLERGLSTVNESVMLRVMGEAQKQIYAPVDKPATCESISTKSETPQPAQ